MGEGAGKRRERKGRDRNGRGEKRGEEKRKRKKRKETNVFEDLICDSLVNILIFLFSSKKIYSEKLKRLSSPRAAGQWLRHVSNSVLLDPQTPILSYTPRYPG